MNKIKWKSITLATLSWMGIILMLIGEGLSKTKDGHIVSEIAEKPLHFTFQTILFVALYYSFNVLNIKTKYEYQIKTLVTIYITITFLIFWSLMAYKYESFTPKFLLLKGITSIFVHGFIPIFAIYIYIKEIKIEGVKISWKLIFISLIYITLWTILAIIFYELTKTPIYSILDYKNKGWKVLMYIFSILVIVVLTSSFYIWLSNKISKNN